MIPSTRFLYIIYNIRTLLIKLSYVFIKSFSYISSYISGVPLVTTRIGASGLCGRCDEDPLSIDIALDASGGGGLNLPNDVECPFIVASDEMEFTRGWWKRHTTDLYGVSSTIQ